MIRKGQIVSSDSKRRFRVGDFIAVGGQGETYWATDLKSGEEGVLKVFFQRFAGKNTIIRIQFLLVQRLQGICAALYAPTDIFSGRKMVGHYAPRAPGQALEELLEKPIFTFLEALQMGIAITHALSVLHDRKIVHGDIHARNFIVEKVGSVLKVYVIDFDNFRAAGVPDPPCIGQEMYLAPELREAMASSRPAVVTLASEYFALAVLLHETLLLRHPATGADANPEDFRRAMCEGRWMHDPAFSNRPSGDLGGYPASILNTGLSRLIRSALSLDPSQRPSADEWKAELSKAFTSVYCCPACEGPCISEVGKDSCPYCGRPFPFLSLQMAGGRSISLANGAVMVGRNDLGGSVKVSARHAVFHHLGPETWLESLGGNGSFRWNGSGWTKLPDREAVLVQSGDRLRLADVEVHLE
jgi:serine/threonine protein kinase